MSRHQWLLSIMSDPMKNGVLADQTLRNNIMASTFLATTAIRVTNCVQSIRYYAHVSCLITAPALKGKRDFIENLNRGSHSWSLGSCAFYLSTPLVLWIYGPIPMFVSCCLTSFILYIWDATTPVTRDLHIKSFREPENDNLESA